MPKDWNAVVNSSEDVIIVRNIESFKTSFTVRRVKYRCSERANPEDRTVQVPLPAGFQASVEFPELSALWQTRRLLIRLSFLDESVKLMDFSVHTDCDNQWFYADPSAVETERGTCTLRADVIVRILDIRPSIEDIQFELRVSYRQRQVSPEAWVEPDLNPVLDPKLNEDMLRLYEDEADTDVVINAGGNEFKAHKFVLVARSGYFRGLFQSGMTEMVNHAINIEDVDSGAFHYLLKFMYCGGLSSSIEKSTMQFQLRLLSLADRLLVKSFVDHFSLYLIPRLKADCLLDAILVATQILNVEKLRKACVEKFADIVEKKSEDFEDMVRRKEFVKLDEAPEVRRELLDIVDECCFRLAPDGVMAALVLADRYKHEELKKSCLERFKSRAKRMIKSQFFKYLDKNSELHRDLLFALVDVNDPSDSDDSDIYSD